MRAFFDTNVLVYLFDADAPEKRKRAGELLKRTAAEGGVVLSTQVLQEFYVATTRKLARPLSSEDAERAVRDLAAFSVIQVDPALILSGIQCGRRHELSFWDGLIVQAALQAGAEVLFTEDLQDGRRIEGLRFENPFRD
jgi:predicted nucleic acid-binding protein